MAHRSRWDQRNETRSASDNDPAHGAPPLDALEFRQLLRRAGDAAAALRRKSQILLGNVARQVVGQLDLSNDRGRPVFLCSDLSLVHVFHQSSSIK